MKAHVERPDCEAILARLKDFQRDTVNHVFTRMYEDSDPAHRYLVADEVGLGKTLVARGVIARTIDHLWEKVDRLDIIYICSNSDIARQNVNKLNVAGEQKFELASRITMLPTLVQDLRNRRLNFISFTPGTSFDLKSSLGMMKERALLYHLLDQAWSIGGRTAPMNVLQGNASSDKFRQLVAEVRRERSIDKDLADRFVRDLNSRCEERSDDPNLRGRFDTLCDLFKSSRSRVPKEQSLSRSRFVGELRGLLAASCLKALEPDLIILDEFQRFKSLLDGEDAAGELAKQLFDYSDDKSNARVLLLSATPYKMYTVTDSDAEDDHYSDFLRTLRFLQGDAVATASTATILEEYRRELRNLADGGAARLPAIKARLEYELRRVMVRTERLAASEDRNGMLVEATRIAGQLQTGDVLSYRALQRVASALDHHDTIELWKSAPWLLSFMDGYKLKENLKKRFDEAGVSGAVSSSPELTIPSGVFTGAPAIEPPNNRMRWLLDETVGRGQWKLLWIPPSNPYYALAGPYSDPLVGETTKRLVFSAWRVVPKAIATLVSYECERQMLKAWNPDIRSISEARKADTLLRFATPDGRVAGMPVMTLLYPSIALAWAGDPLKHQARQVSDALPALSEISLGVTARIRGLLASLLKDAGTTGPADERWYWAAPILLDLKLAAKDTHAWLGDAALAARWSGADEERGDGGDSQLTGGARADESAWSLHVAELLRVATNGHDLGPPPTDLEEVLALQAIASPAVCALRSFARVAGRDEAIVNPDVRMAAGRLAWSFRGLFNLPEVTALIRSFDRTEPYWRRALEYCAFGGLQAVVDEYAHVLHDGLGLLDATHEDVAQQIGEEMRTALSLRTASLGVDEIEGGAKPSIKSHRMRGRFALRFGEEETVDGEERSRADHVRKAFNSPFWPFVLASTSVGQEGLDFHSYCHAVVHWNLPSNPVDLEQREGRVHRYKGHAVRKNVVRHHGRAGHSADHGDPWLRIFDAAAADRPAGSNELIPYWMYAVPGGARIERHVLALPLSRDLERLDQLRKSLAIYRMVFGQPRQDELLDFLLARMTREEIMSHLELLRIELSPPPVRVGSVAHH